MSEKVPNRSAGGKARAKKLSKQELSAIARTAAAARWNLPTAQKDGRMGIGGWDVPCWVLADERRVVSQPSFMELVGIEKSKKKGAGQQISKVLTKTEITSQKFQDLITVIQTPIKFLDTQGFTVLGYEGEVIIDYCDALLYARRMKVLLGHSLVYAEAAERLVSSAAKVGIIALIDEATGYQEIRDKNALQALLDRYLRKEFSAWAKRFPDDFYKEIFRLKGWEWQGMKINRPSCVGKYTNDLVYARLEVGILKELKVRNPWDSEKKRRKGYHHTLLTEDFGAPVLVQHLYTLIAIMRGFGDGKWDRFKEFLDKTLPRKGDSIQLLFTFAEEDDQLEGLSDLKDQSTSV